MAISATVARGGSSTMAGRFGGNERYVRGMEGLMAGRDGVWGGGLYDVYMCESRWDGG